MGRGLAENGDLLFSLFSPPALSYGFQASCSLRMGHPSSYYDKHADGEDNDDFDMGSLPQAPQELGYLHLPNRLSFHDPPSIIKFLEERLGTREYYNCPIFNVPSVKTSHLP